MSVLSIKVPDEILDRLTRLAALENLTLDEVVGDALQRLTVVAEQNDYLRQRAIRGRGVSMRALLDKNKNVPPLPGDELPDEFAEGGSPVQPAQPPRI
jgi:hypothetical protein